MKSARFRLGLPSTGAIAGVGGVSVHCSRDHVNACVACDANQLLCDRFAEEIAPARAFRFGDDDMGKIIGLRIFGDGLGDILSRN